MTKYRMHIVIVNCFMDQLLKCIQMPKWAENVQTLHLNSWYINITDHCVTRRPLSMSFLTFCKKSFVLHDFPKKSLLTKLMDLSANKDMWEMMCQSACLYVRNDVPIGMLWCHWQMIQAKPFAHCALSQRLCIMITPAPLLAKVQTKPTWKPMHLFKKGYSLHLSRTYRDFGCWTSWVFF